MNRPHLSIDLETACGDWLVQHSGILESCDANEDGFPLLIGQRH